MKTEFYQRFLQEVKIPILSGEVDFDNPLEVKIPVESNGYKLTDLYISVRKERIPKSKNKYQYVMAFDNDYVNVSTKALKNANVHLGQGMPMYYEDRQRLWWLMCDDDILHTTLPDFISDRKKLKGTYYEVMSKFIEIWNEFIGCLKVIHDCQIINEYLHLCSNLITMKSPDRVHSDMIHIETMNDRYIKHGRVSDPTYEGNKWFENLNKLGYKFPDFNVFYL